MIHVMTMTLTGRRTAPWRLDCSCGETTTVDNEGQYRDRAKAHMTAANERDLGVRRANRSPYYLMHHR